MNSASSFMEALKANNANFQFRPTQQVAALLAGRASQPAGPRTQAYKGLWSRLATLLIPVTQLEMIMAVLILGDLYEGWVNNGVARTIMLTPLTSADIGALRDALPRLPSELNVVLKAHKTPNTCAVTLIQALPRVLESVIAPNLEQATAIRLALINLTLNLGLIIDPTVNEMTALRSELTSIPLQLGHGFGINQTKFGRLCYSHPAIAWKIEAVKNIGYYEDWFAVRHALNFAEGLQMFGDAADALDDGNVKQAYFRFYAYYTDLITRN
ncbi:uncharacterized protein N7529_012100 [Penicillium soppii]|uniref:uncharacterized protein n=1 Tax=Penicillium soppii TaxID=69789 RepID=UPI002546DC6E|nr:uncharacterized protein N7529_012100 [Penicillium soppii]KAJ5852715.1 hypothetical protein N7529_012100 [Penicillium soppii]